MQFVVTLAWNERSALHVLFVCTGNICRSPTAERLAAARSARLQVPQFTVASAGLRAVIGYPIHPHAAQVLQRLGGDTSGFAARQFTPKLGANADLVLTMTTAHRDAVLERAPRLLNRTFTLSEAALLATEFEVVAAAKLADVRGQIAAAEFEDIPDPIGQDHEVFASVGAQIAELVPPIIELCLRSSSPEGSF